MIKILLMKTLINSSLIIIEMDTIYIRRRLPFFQFSNGCWIAQFHFCCFCSQENEWFNELISSYRQAYSAYPCYPYLYTAIFKHVIVCNGNNNNLQIMYIIMSNHFGFIIITCYLITCSTVKQTMNYHSIPRKHSITISKELFS